MRPGVTPFGIAKTAQREAASQRPREHLDLHGGASGEGGEGGPPAKEMKVYRSMVVMRTSRPHFIQGVLGGRSGRGPLAGLMAPRGAWRWGRGWNLCGEISQFSIASGNWKLVMRSAWSVGSRACTGFSARERRALRSPRPSGLRVHQPPPPRAC